MHPSSSATFSFIFGSLERDDLAAWRSAFSVELVSSISFICSARDSRAAFWLEATVSLQYNIHKCTTIYVKFFANESKIKRQNWRKFSRIQHLLFLTLNANLFTTTIYSTKNMCWVVSQNQQVQLKLQQNITTDWHTYIHTSCWEWPIAYVESRDFLSMAFCSCSFSMVSAEDWALVCFSSSSRPEILVRAITRSLFCNSG